MVDMNEYRQVVAEMEQARKKFGNMLFASILVALAILSVVVSFLFPWGPSTDSTIGFFLACASVALAFYVRYLGMLWLAFDKTRRLVRHYDNALAKQEYPKIAMVQ